MKLLRPSACLLALLVACSGPSSAVPRTAGQPEARSVAAAPAPVPAARPAAAPTPVPAASPAPAPPAAAREPIELTFVGDVIFGRYRASGYDPIPGPADQPFAEIAELMRSDLLVGNLETPLVRDLPVKSPIGAQYAFGAAQDMTRHLVSGGFTAMSLANNHAFDQRALGMEQSPEILREAGVIPLGAARKEEPVFRVETIERRGWKVGFLAVTSRRNAPHFAGTPMLPFLSTTDLSSTLGPLIEAARGSHDLIVVYIHWGEEYADAPANYQRVQARALIDRGANLVVGHHPHVLQGIEAHGAGAVAYSLGNFLFENTNDIPRLTGVLRARFDARACLEALTLHPAYIKRTPSKHPAPATGGMGKRVRARVRELSDALGTPLVEAGEDLVLRDRPCPERQSTAAAPSPG